MLQSFLFEIKDHRRKQGQRYQLGHILLFSVLAILSNATSYRQVHTFIKSHYETLDKTFGLNWKRLPAYTTIRAIIQGTLRDEIERSFREYSDFLARSDMGKRFVAFDGKVLRGSFDHFQDQKAIQVLSAFLTGCRIILAHLSGRLTRFPPHKSSWRNWDSRTTFSPSMPFIARKRPWKSPKRLETMRLYR